MSYLRLLLVEDSAGDCELYRIAAARYKDEKQRDIELVVKNTIEEAIEGLNNSFDGAIIDLKIDGHLDGGTQVINEIMRRFYRIPVAIVTGTPGSQDQNLNYIGVFTKGEIEYMNLLDKFWDIHCTGLTKIMGGRGKIEETLNAVFQKNLLPHIEPWIGYGKVDPPRTEKALLRYTLNHLLQLLDEDGDLYYSEEVYIYPPLTESIKTGSIVKKKGTELFFVVMNPACDLVVRGGKCNTDRILIVEIDAVSMTKTVGKMQHTRNGKILKKCQECQHHNPDSVSFKNVQDCHQKSLESCISKLFKNTHDIYHHWLPGKHGFHGGFLNFRKLKTLNKTEFDAEFDIPIVQISPPFVKDIVARFASYYARQGQPDIDCGSNINQVIEEVKA